VVDQWIRQARIRASWCQRLVHGSDFWRTTGSGSAVKLHYSLLEIWKVVVRRIERVLVSPVVYCPRNASIPSTLHLQLSSHILDRKLAWAL
jgi:hypothetical protein